MISRYETEHRKMYREGVAHTTLNPHGPGAVRIHLVPPRWRPFSRRPYVLILNGYYILPVGYSWAVLLRNFITAVNAYSGAPMSDEDMQRAADEAVDKTHAIYRKADRDMMSRDLNEMLTALYSISRGEVPDTEVGMVSLRHYAGFMRAPHRMDLMVSAMTKENGDWNCNLKCRHCYAAGQPAAGARELAGDEWRRVIDKCREAGIPQLTFTGGEPTLRPDLPELVAHAKWFVTRLNTNGTLLTPELCKALYDADLDSVQITLYSHDKAVHDALVGTPGGWDLTIRGLRAALEAGLDVSVNTPLCGDNLDYSETLRFLHGEGVRYVSCSGLIETGNAAGEESLSSRLTEPQLRKILRDAADVCRELEMEISFTSPGQIDPNYLRFLGLTVPMCGACLSNMAVAPDGAVVPCQSWLSAGASLGNMLETPWKEIWNSKLCKQIRSMDETAALFCPLRQIREGDTRCE